MQSNFIPPSVSTTWINCGSLLVKNLPSVLHVLPSLNYHVSKCILPGESIKRPAFQEILLPEYRSNDIENCLVLSPICQIRFRNLPGFNRTFLPNEMGDFFAESPFRQPAKMSENTKQNFPLFSFQAIMTPGRVHVFRPLGRMESP